MNIIYLFMIKTDLFPLTDISVNATLFLLGKGTLQGTCGTLNSMFPNRALLHVWTI